MAHHSAFRYVSCIWQNNAKPLISNGLRFIITCLLTAALGGLFHPERITFTTGNLTPPVVNIRIQENKRIIHAEWLRQPLSPIAKDEDDLFLVIYDTQEQDSLAYPLGKRGLPGTKKYPLHEDFTPANCIAYVFALSPINRRASVSKYSNIILE